MSKAAQPVEVSLEGSVRHVKLSLGKAHTRRRRKVAWVVKSGWRRAWKKGSMDLTRSEVDETNHGAEKGHFAKKKRNIARIGPVFNRCRNL